MSKTPGFGRKFLVITSAALLAASILILGLVPLIGSSETEETIELVDEGVPLAGLPELEGPGRQVIISSPSAGTDAPRT